MNYKIALPNEQYKMHTGQDTRNFTIKKTEDKVILRFDEENQVFYAKIENPSQHTRYLFQQHRLAISLSKLNTGRSQRKKMGDKYWPGDMYWDEEDQEWKNKTDFYVKKKCHPRWSRCYKNGVVVHEAISSLDEEIEIPFYIRDLKPNQRHTIGNYWRSKWYNSIKAVLVSCFAPLTTSQFNNNYSNGCRAYKTMSNRIKIEYDSENDIIINRKKRYHWNDYYNLSAHIVSQDDKTFQIQIDDMGSRVEQAFNEGRLYVGYEYLEGGDYALKGHAPKMLRYGEWNGDEKDRDRYLKNRRFKNRRESKMVCPAKSKQKIVSTSITYSLPSDSSEFIFGCHSPFLNLFTKVKYSQRVNSRIPNIVIGMIEGNGGENLLDYSCMTLWRHSSGVEYVWYGKLPD